MSRSRPPASSARNAAWSRAAASRAGSGRAGAVSSRSATAPVRSARPARMRIWTGPVREFSHRPYAAVSASCSAGVRSARLTVDTAAATAAPPSPRPITPSAGHAPGTAGSSGAGGPPLRRASCGPAQAGGAGMPPGAVTSRRGDAGVPPRGDQQPVQGQPVPLPDHQGRRRDRQRCGQDGEHRRRHQAPGGLERGPDDDRRGSEDGDLAGGQPGEDLVRALDVGGDGDAGGRGRKTSPVITSGEVRHGGRRVPGGGQGGGGGLPVARGCRRRAGRGQRRLPVPVPAAPGRRRRRRGLAGRCGRLPRGRRRVEQGKLAVAGQARG